MAQIWQIDYLVEKIESRFWKKICYVIIIIRIVINLVMLVLMQENYNEAVRNGG